MMWATLDYYILPKYTKVKFLILLGFQVVTHCGKLDFSGN
jgi:hypothetical protein